MITGNNKFYLTKEGVNKIKKEYERLLSFKKAKVKEDVPSTWSSEEVNPEYLAFQEDMNLLDSRIVEHENILNNTELIRIPPKKERHIVSLGAIIKIEQDGEIDEFTIVGTLEADPVQKKISNESPLGQNLLGAKIGDIIVVKTSIVNHHCRILKIKYA